VSKRPWAQALRDPPVKPNGIRDRAARAVEERGPQREDKGKTRRSRKYWTTLAISPSRRRAA